MPNTDPAGIEGCLHEFGLALLARPIWAQGWVGIAFAVLSNRYRIFPVATS
jgi:hypothetical protein